MVMWLSGASTGAARDDLIRRSALTASSQEGLDDVAGHVDSSRPPQSSAVTGSSRANQSSLVDYSSALAVAGLVFNS